MPSLGAESFVFRFCIQKCKDQGIQNYNFNLLFCMGMKHDRSHRGKKVS